MKRWLVPLIIGLIIGGNVAGATVEVGPTKYLKRDGPDTMPYRLVLRKNCRNAEDTMGKLILVEYTPERVVYRCRWPWQY